MARALEENPTWNWYIDYLARKERAMTQILPNPIVNLDSDGRLVRLHCGTPGERCNLDDAKDKRTTTWAEAFSLMRRTDYRTSLVSDFACLFCFGGEGE